MFRGIAAAFCACALFAPCVGARAADAVGDSDFPLVPSVVLAAIGGLILYLLVRAFMRATRTDYKVAALAGAATGAIFGYLLSSVVSGLVIWIVAALVYLVLITLAKGKRRGDGWYEVGGGPSGDGWSLSDLFSGSGGDFGGGGASGDWGGGGD